MAGLIFARRTQILDHNHCCCQWEGPELSEPYSEILPLSHDQLALCHPEAQCYSFTGASVLQEGWARLGISTTSHYQTANSDHPHSILPFLSINGFCQATTSYVYTCLNPWRCSKVTQQAMILRKDLSAQSTQKPQGKKVLLFNPEHYSTQVTESILTSHSAHPREDRNF